MSWHVVSPLAHAWMHELSVRHSESAVHVLYCEAHVPDSEVEAHDEHVEVVATHVEPEQSSPDEHEWPHAPQLVVDVVVSTHVPAQSVWPGTVHPVVVP